MSSKKIMKIGVVLFIVCVISAIVLASLNMLLKDRIKENEGKKVREGIAFVTNDDFAANYEVEELDYQKKDSAVKATAKITKRYYYEETSVYQVEGSNSFGGSVMLVSIEEGIIEEVYLVSFEQTNAANLIKGLPEEYLGKEALISNILPDDYIKENYAGGTRGSRMMNLMIKVIIEYTEVTA